MFPVIGNPPEASYPILVREYKNLIGTSDVSVRRAIKRNLLVGIDYVVGMYYKVILLPSGILKLNKWYESRGVNIDERRQWFYNTKMRDPYAINSIRKRAQKIMGKLAKGKTNG
jgi:hypothetical protein